MGEPQINQWDRLIADAINSAGGSSCAGGHAWVSQGGRHCAPCQDQHPTQTVYQCERCGEWDYGYPGGPGHEDCKRYCGLSDDR